MNLHSFPASGISRATLLATSLGLAAVVQANDIIKLDNSDALNTGGSWTGGNVPTASDVGVWDSTVTAENITVLGGDLSWAGIKIADPGGAVTIDAGSTLSLGASGIDLSAATQNLTLNNAISLGTAQIWNVASDRTLTAGGVIGGTGTLTKSGAGTLTLSAANTFANGATISDGTIIAGNNAAFGTGTLTMSGGTITTSGVRTFNNPVFVAANTVTNIYGYNGGGNYPRFTGPITGSGTIQNKPLQGGLGNAFIDGDISGFTGTINVESGPAAGDNFQFSGTLPANREGGQARFVVNGTGSGAFYPLEVANITFKMGELSGTGGTISSVASGTLEIGALNTNSSYSGTITAGAGIALTKVGTGKLTLSGPGIKYGNATNVNNGTLSLLNATAYASTTTTVTSPGVLNLDGIWTFAKAVNGSGGLSRSGSGEVAISVAQSYTGATTIDSGTLTLSGSGAVNSSSGIVINGATAKFVQNSATASTPAITVTQGVLDGTGTVGAVTVGAGTGGIVDGGNNGTGTLTAASLTFDGAGTVGGALTASATPIVVSGALTTSGGANSVSVSLTGGVPANGTYHLIQFGSYGGGIGNFKFASPVRALSLQQNGNFIDVVVNGSNYPIWTGGGSGDWSTNGSSGNWKLSSDSSATDFLALDNTLFDDTATGTTDIVVGQTDVSPGVITFNNSTKDYTLTQQNGKDIISGSLVKTGSGKLTISGGFSFPGGSTLSGGTVSIATETALGTGSRTFNGGTLEYTGGTATWIRASTVNAPGGTLSVTDANAVLTHTGNLTGTGVLTKAGAGTLTISKTSGTIDTPLAITAGTLNLNYGEGNLTYAGNITGSSGVLSLEGTGASPTTGLTLTGNNTFSGETHIHGRRIFLNSATTNGGLGGNIVVKDGNWPFHGLTVMTNEQIADSAVLRFENTAEAYDFRLNGKTETLAGIESLSSGQDNSFCIIENAGHDGGNDPDGMADGTLIVSGSGTYSFYGQLRDQNNPSGTNKLNFTKAGTGTQTLTGPGIFYSGTTLVSGGTLVLDSATSFKSSAVTVQSGATLEIQNATTLSETPALNVATGGILKVGSEGTGTYTVPAAQTLAGSGSVTGGLTVDGTVSPGDGIGTLTSSGYCDFGTDSHIVWQVGGSWASPTGDSIQCQGFGVLSDDVDPTVITISPEGLTGFTETAKTFTLVQGTESGQGFSASAFQIDASAFVTATGSFGTWSIQENGNNLELVYTPGSATPYNVWAAENIDNPNDRAELDDPDQDGLANVLEFVLDSNPSSGAITNLPTVTASGNDFVFTFNRRDDAASLNPTVEFNSDLGATWTTAVNGVNCTIGVTANGADPDTVTVTIPKGANTKLFARLKVP